MTLGRTGLGARTTRSPFALSFTRDRTDGGGGGADGGQDSSDDGGDDDVDDTGTDDDDAGTDDDDDDDDDAKLGDAGKRALKAEREKVKELRRQVRELRNGKGKGDTDDKGKAGEGETPEQVAAREAAATERAREVAKPFIVETKAESLLREAGLVGEPGRLLKLLELDDVEVVYDSRGRVTDIDGLDDQIDGLREDYPSLFAAKKKNGGRIDGADRRTDVSRVKKSASEIQAAGLRGGR